jgi:hypothetical protein
MVKPDFGTHQRRSVTNVGLTESLNLRFGLNRLGICDWGPIDDYFVLHELVSQFSYNICEYLLDQDDSQWQD